MPAPAPDPGAEAPQAAPEPTVRLARPAAPPRPGHPDDASTVDLPRSAPRIRQRTLQFGRPAPVRVTVTARRRPRRRLRTWPLIAAVVLALVVVGAVLLVMLLQGARLD